MGSLTSEKSASVETWLADWNRTLDQALQNDEPEVVLQIAPIVLNLLPRHVGIYQRLLRALWSLKRWHEGAEWARRLLQADPANALAWRALGRAAEQEGNRQEANSIFRRAFECDPYEPEIRSSVRRTSLIGEKSLELNLACLATLYLRGQRWQQAAESYRALLQYDSRRVDFQCGLLMALWQGGAERDSYQLAQELRHSYPHLLLAWTVVNEFGDENDRALAYQPLQSMDPDCDYRRHWWGLSVELQPIELWVSEEVVEVQSSRVAK